MFAEFLRSRCPDYRVEYARHRSGHPNKPHYGYRIEGPENTLTVDVPDAALAKLHFADMWSALEPLLREERDWDHVRVVDNGDGARVVRLEHG
jgi:hypothetical protein